MTAKRLWSQPNPEAIQSWFTPDIQKEIVKLYSEGHGTAAISIILKLPCTKVYFFVKDKGIMRSRVEGIKISPTAKKALVNARSLK